ncbi:hypothetical protein ZIOFF_012091 [Zingiber officinale]|uniref:Protein kinase domain-containing protein n=1 Tax=Zingiber officinale TaxID=94328 RepID=A0A8J5LL88_ZINOF|nr:hypothetical protein ZIOFF_012091 [Zingiber officinale]
MLYLPPEISYLKRVQELDISFNKLNYSPAAISEISSIRSMKIANNKLVDPPSCLSSMADLEMLDLSNNRLTSLSSLRLSSMHALQLLNLQLFDTVMPTVKSVHSLSNLYSHETKSTSRSVIHCEFGTVDAAVKTSADGVKEFECILLGEVRRLGALRNHKHIMNIYDHQLSCKWLPALDGKEGDRLLQSMIIMEYTYLNHLREEGQKHVPADIALCIANFLRTSA